jgi:hypothetical protein
LDASVAARITPTAAFAGPPGGEQKARVNSAANPSGNAQNKLKNMTFKLVQVIIENQAH